MVLVPRSLLFCLVSASTLSGLAFAQTSPIVPLLARLDGAQVVPPLVTSAHGLGWVVVDKQAQSYQVRELHTGIASPLAQVLVRGYSGPGGTAGILHSLSSGSPHCGAFLPSSFQIDFAAQGLVYLEVQSSQSSPGVPTQFQNEIRGQIAESPNQATFCYGDGSGTACPCGNTSTPGYEEGCLHAPGIGGRLVGYVDSAAGTPSLANDRLVLHAFRLPDDTVVQFLQGTQPAASGAGVPFGNGLLCIGGSIGRLDLKSACNGQVGSPEPGEQSISVSGAVAPGTYYYQARFRTNPPFCSSSAGFFNLTNAVQTTWVP